MSDKYRQMLQRLLPRGPAWTREPGSQLTALLQGLAVEAQRVEDRALVLIEEADPRTTTELIDDWERVCGLPGDCTAPTAIADRRALVVQKLLGHGDPNLAFWQEQAEALGFTFVSIEEYQPFSAGDRAGDHVIGLDWLFCWVLVVATRTAALNELLRCTVEGLTPIHTEVEVFAQPYATWVRVKPELGDYTGVFRAVASSEPGTSGVLFVAVGDSAEIEWSTDGATWWNAAPAGGYAGDFKGVCQYQTSYWFAVGTAHRIQRSIDNGSTWADDTPAAYAGNFYAVATVNDGNGTDAIAVGTGGEIQHCTDFSDPTSWVTRAAAGGYVGIFRAIASNRLDDADAMTVIVGDTGEIEYYCAYTYGEIWQKATPDAGYTGDFYSATYANGFFWIGGEDGELQQSRDGITWRRITNNVNDIITSICGDRVEGILYTSLTDAIWARNRVGAEMIHVPVTWDTHGLDSLGIAVTGNIAVRVNEDGIIDRATRFGT